MLLLCQGRLVFEGGVDGAGEVSFEAAEGFAAALPFGLFAFHVGACGRVDAGLGDRDLVQGPVELAVAAAVESVASVFAAACFEWCDAGVAGELGVGGEAVDRADLAEQFRGRDGAAAGQRPQTRRHRCCSGREVAFGLSDRAGQRPAAADELPRDRRLDRLLAAGEAASEPVEPDRPVEPTCGDTEERVELVQMPAQTLLGSCSLGNETVTVIDEHLQLPQHRLLRARVVEPRLPQRGPSDSERVDRIRLAPLPACPPLRRGQLRRHPHQPLTRDNKITLEPAGQLPAVLNRPQPLAGKRCRPDKQAGTIDRRLLADLTTDLVDRDRRQRGLVYVHTDHDH